MEPCWEWEEESKVNRGVNVTSVDYIDARNCQKQLKHSFSLLFIY